MAQKREDRTVCWLVIISRYMIFWLANKIIYVPVVLIILNVIGVEQISTNRIQHYTYLCTSIYDFLIDF